MPLPLQGQIYLKILESCLRGNDIKGHFRSFYENTSFEQLNKKPV